MFFGIFKNRKYNKIIKSAQDNSASNLRSRIKILFVDDEKFSIVDSLRERGYRIYYKQDVDYVEDAEAYDLIILDIKGVAVSRFKGSMEGLSYAKEVKIKYPHKIVACFSGSMNPAISEELQSLDGFIQKDYDLDRWCQKLDSFIERYSSIDYHWLIIKEQLRKQGIDLGIIQDIEKIYKESYEYGNFDNLRNYMVFNLKDIKLLLDFIKSLTDLLKLFV